MTRSAPGNRFRTRKLSTKQSLAVLRENQIDSVDDDGQRNIPQIETGVERQEEIVRCLLSPPLLFLERDAATTTKQQKKPTCNINPNQRTAHQNSLCCVLLIVILDTMIMIHTFLAHFLHPLRSSCAISRHSR
jgi:hypothetical protein